MEWDEEIITTFKTFQKTILPENKVAEIYRRNLYNSIFNKNSNFWYHRDQQTALFRQNCTKPGIVKTYGTGCFLLMNFETKQFTQKTIYLQL